MNWEFEKDMMEFVDEDGESYISNYAYDPRLIKIENTYYIVWCTDFCGPALAVAKTTDFKKFVRIENMSLPFNRNGVLFPRRINGNYVMMSRTSDSGHTPFGNIFVSESPDMIFWGKHKCVMTKSNNIWWQDLKIGGGS